GAEAFGMGNTNLTVGNTWAVFNNIGALARADEMAMAVNYTNYYGISGFNTVGAAFVTPLNIGKNGGMAGAGFWNFGDGNYSENKVSLGYSHKIGMMSLGIQVNYFQTMIAEFGTKSVIALELGGVADLREDLKLGMHIYNFNQAKLANFEDERIPTIMRAGLSYEPIKKLMLNLETEKEVDEPAMFKAGLAYQVLEDKLTFRTGLSTEPFINYFGLGFKYKFLIIDYALNTHPDLNMTNHLSIVYRFEKITRRKVSKN
ncbi:MAG: hypothetical protein AAF740_07470, partial [Bacteroidota bacterium]